MCYQKPDELLAHITPDPMPRNEIGHTPFDDFAHFCAVSGLNEAQAGREAFAWAKAAFVSAWLGRHDIAANYAD